VPWPTFEPGTPEHKSRVFLLTEVIMLPLLLLLLMVVMTISRFINTMKVVKRVQNCPCAKAPQHKDI
jgi:hypothetical protein